MAVIRLSLFLSLLQCSVKLSKSEPILIIALPQSDHTEVSASWERGEEILPGALAAINETKNNSSNFTVIEVTSEPVTSYGLSYSGNVLEVIASLTWQNRISDIIGIAGVFHPNILAVLNRFQWPHLAEWCWTVHTTYCCYHSTENASSVSHFYSSQNSKAKHKLVRYCPKIWPAIQIYHDCKHGGH